MDQNDDFTFCQVGLPVTNDDIDQQKILPVGEISLEDKDGSYNGNGKDAMKGNFQGPPSMKKEENVGSLCFSVSDASFQKQQSSSSGNAGPLAKGDQERTVARKPAPRAKVPFEKGYSQMDWLKLTRAHPDLAGLNGQSNRRLISMSEVKQHQAEGSMWAVLKGRVYNISPYMKFHPGGVDILMKAVGKDCTSLFNKYHAWVNAEFLLEKCLVGTLDADGQ